MILVNMIYTKGSHNMPEGRPSACQRFSILWLKIFHGLALLSQGGAGFYIRNWMHFLVRNSDCTQNEKLSQSIKTLCPFLRILNTIQKLNLMFGTIIQPSFNEEESMKMKFLNIEFRSSETKDCGENITNRDL